MANSFIQRFLFDSLPIRGAYVDLTDAWQTIAAQKEYPNGIKKVLGELIAANVLMTSNLKFHGKVIAQMQGNPKFDLIVSECSQDFQIRATAKFERSVHEDNQDNYEDCLAQGNLAISIDSKKDGRIYQSVIALMHEDLAQALIKYMYQSEQLCTVFVLAYTETRVIGFMLQQLPDHSGVWEDDINRILLLGETLTKHELLNYNLSEILKKLFSEDDLVIFDQEAVCFKCSCSRDRVSGMLRSLGLKEALSIIADEGKIKVTCDFCNTMYEFNESDVQDIFSTLGFDIECISQELH